MIVYVISKQPKSLLLSIQQRIWREHHPQCDFMVLVSRRSIITDYVNHAIGMIKPSGHRFAFIIHEDCIPLKPIDPETVLQGKSLAGRVAPDGKTLHPSRTWIAADSQTPGKTEIGYGQRQVTLDDVQADASLLSKFEYLEPGFLHLDSWYKHSAGCEIWQAKRDWILSAYSDYAQLPSLPARVLSFTKAVKDTLTDSGPRIVPREVWQERLSICNECDAFENGRCRFCGCGMRTKSRMKSQDCPIGRWPLFEDQVPEENESG